MERADIARKCEEISNGIWSRLEHGTVENTGPIIENSDGSCCLPPKPIESNATPIFQTVRLDGMDHIEFKSLCADIFAKAGYFVKRRTATSHGIHVVSPDGVSTYVECIHRVKHSSGSQYVQSVHDHMVIHKYAKGFMINTGTFTAGAVERAQKLTATDHPVELHDLQKLADMAAKVGIRIADYPQTFTCPVLDFDKLVSMVIKDANLQDDYGRLHSMFDVQVRVIAYKPYWLADASVRRDFIESVGIIHSVDKRETCLVNDAGDQLFCPFHESLEALPEESQDLMQEIPDFNNYFESMKEIIERRMPDFRTTPESMKKIIKRRIADRHGNTVKYVGRHGTIHEEWCRLKPDDVTIHQVAKVYVPVYSVEFNRRCKSYTVEVTSINQKLAFTRNDLERCGICYRRPHRPTLCRSCGDIMHRRSIWDVIGGRCAFECSRCGKNVCRECTRCTGRILRRHFCKTCAPDEANYC